MHNKLKIEEALNILQQPVLGKTNLLIEAFCLVLSCLEVEVLLHMGIIFFFIGKLSLSLFNPPFPVFRCKMHEKDANITFGERLLNF